MIPQHASPSKVVGRLAPTPSGKLHLGNACAFAAAWLSTRQQGGELLLRFEDIDTTRARRNIEDSQRRDLEWLGLTWDREVPRQSSRSYLSWMARLGDATYHCKCTRASIRAAGGVHPESCRGRGASEGAVRFAVPPHEVAFVDRKRGLRTVSPAASGDPVLRRRDGIFAYSLAVVVDDIRDGVDEVVRGADLLDHSALQMVLWRAFEASPPTWLHTPLILGEDGRKLSKSHGSLHIEAMRDAGWSAPHIWRLLLPALGIHGQDNLDNAVGSWVPNAICHGPLTLNTEMGLSPGQVGLQGLDIASDE